MFKRKTLFIVGAGASAEVGFPAGASLARDIGRRLIFQIDPFGRVSAGNDLELISQIKRSFAPSAGAHLKACQTIRDGILLANSIDDFLNIHSENEALVQVGKAAIVRAIHAAEARSLLWVDPSNMHNKLDYNKIDGSWFTKFMRVLGPGITVGEVTRIFENTSFIVFNYDRCIEHFLTHALQNLYGITKRDAAKIVASINIIHPYGSIGSLHDLPFGGPENDRFNSHDYVELSRGIKTYTEQVEDEAALTTMQKEVTTAECIVYLGFAYHAQNMMLLNPREAAAANQIFGTAFNMSDSDQGKVISEISRNFTNTVGTSLSKRRIYIENKLKCSDLFDYYAKSLAG